MRRLSLVMLALAASSLLVLNATASGDAEVRVKDACDPNTFPPEAQCIGRGNVTFQEFLAKLNPIDGGHKKWIFDFGRGHIDEGEALRVVNEGGEAHSFAEVSMYGTGIVPPLNGALPAGTPPAVAVGFGSLEAANGATIVLPNSTREFSGLAPGRHKFQCLIHPWMRLEVDVRRR